MNKPERPSSDDAESLEYANLLEQLTQAMEAGKKIDWTEIASRYPKWMNSIKSELRTIQTLLDAGNITFADDIALPDSAPIPHIEGYQLQRRVGAGGMGIVYEAIELSLQRKVAIKVLSTQLRPNSLVRIRFENEATAAGKLNHPNILPVYKIGESGSLIYYVMPYVDGTTLSDLAAQSEKSYPSIAAIVYQIALALNHAHESGVFHRDVKPSNIMLDRHGHAWLLDFGLASLDEQLDLTQTGEIVGTLRYMSPERLAPKTARTLDRRLDVYSLGATLYELLSGQAPYHGVAKPALSKAIQETAPVSLRQLASSVPLSLIRICEKAMEREPLDRYSNCSEMAADLQRFLVGKDVKARPLSSTRRLSRQIRQHALKILSATTLAVFVLAGSVVMLQRSKTIELRENTIEFQNKLMELQAKELRLQKFYLEIAKLRETRENAEIGWRVKHRETLQELARENWTGEELSLLKKEWLATNRAIDIQEEQVLLNDRAVYRCEWNDSGTQLVAGFAISEANEPTLMVFNGETLQLQYPVKLPTPAELGVGEHVSDGVRVLRFSADQTRLFVGTRRGLLHEVKMANGEVLRSKACHSTAIYGLVLCEDFGEIITGGSDNRVRVWDLESLTERKVFETSQNVRSIAHKDDALWVLDGRLLRLKREGGKWSEPIDLKVEMGDLPSKVSEDGSLIYNFGNEGIELVSPETHSVARRYFFAANQTNPRFTNAHELVTCDKDLLFTTDSNGLKMWNQVNGAQLGTLSIANNENAGVAYKPNSRKLAIWGQHKLAVYRIDRNTAWGATPARAYPIHSFHLQNTVNSDKPGVLVSTRSVGGEVQSQEYAVEFYPWDSGEGIRSHFYPKGPVQILAAYRDGFVSHQYPDDFLMWSNWIRPTWDDRYSFPPFDPEFCSYHDPSGNILYCSRRVPSPDVISRVRFIPLVVAVSDATRSTLWQYEPIKSHNTDTSFTIKSVVGCDSSLFLACDDQRIRELNARTGEEVRDFSFGDHSCVSLSIVDSQQILVGCADGKVIVIDRDSGLIVGQATLHKNRINSIEGISSGYFVSGGIDGDLVLARWNGKGIEEHLRVPHTRTAINRIQVTADGERICYLCRNEHSVRYLDWKKVLEELHQFR